MVLNVIQAPAEQPLTVSGAKQHLRVSTSEDDALINSLISAGTTWIEETTGVALVSGTYLLIRNTLGSAMEVPRSPVLSIVSVVLVDQDGIETTVDPSIYELDSAQLPNRVVVRDSKSWPSVSLKSHGGVRIQFAAGYGSAEDVPDVLKAALKILTADMYENRESVVIGSTASGIPLSMKALLAPYKIRLSEED